MSTIVITTKSVQNRNLYELLAQQLGDLMKVLSDDEMEDLVLGTAMNMGRTGKITPTQAVLKKLRSK